MKNTNSKLLVVLSVLFSLLLVLSSCQKKTESGVSAEDIENASETVVDNIEKEESVSPEEKPSESENVTPVTIEDVFASLSDEEEKGEVESERLEEPQPAIEDISVSYSELYEDDATEEHIFADTLSYGGYSVSIAADSSSAAITLIDGIARDDIPYLARLIRNAYPEESSLVSYTVDNDSLTLSYPEQSEEFILSAIEVLKNEASALIDSLEPEAVENDSLDAGSAVTSEPSEEESPASVYSSLLSYGGIQTEVEIYSDHAFVTVPETFTEDDVLYVISLVSAMYPVETSFVAYSYSDGVLYLEYPECDDAYLAAALNELERKAVRIIDDTVDNDSITVVDISSSGSDEDFELSFVYSHNGYSTSVRATESRAVISIPEGVSSSDIAYLAGYFSLRYPDESSYVYYSIDSDNLILEYPEESAEYITLALQYISNDLDALLNRTEREETEEKEGEVEIQENADDSSYVTKEYVTADELTPSHFIEVVEVETSDIPADVSESVNENHDSLLKEEKAFRGFSIAAVASPKYCILGNENEKFDFLFGVRAEYGFKAFSLGLEAEYELNSSLSAGAYFKYAFLDFEKSVLYGYLKCSAQFDVPQFSSVLFSLDAGLGYEYRFTESISVFTEASVMWTIEKNALLIGGSAGIVFTF